MSSTSQSPTATVALYLSRSSNRDPCCQFLQCTLWVAAASANNSSSTSLDYYSFVDDPSQWTHLQIVLTTLKAAYSNNNNVVIHVTADAKLLKQQPHVSRTIIAPLLQLLERLTQGETATTDEDDTATAAATMTNHVAWHESSSLPSFDASRLQAILQQLLTQESALQLKVTVALDNDVSRALVLYLHATQQWNFATAVADDDNLQSLVLQPLYNNGTSSSSTTSAPYLWLDATAAKTIHLWPPMTQTATLDTGGNVHNNSLLGILSQPLQTKPGHRLLQAWLRHPLTDLPRLQQRQDAVTWLVQHGVSRDAVQQEGLRLLAGGSKGGNSNSLADLNALACHLYSYSEATTSDDGGDDDSGNKAGTTALGSTRKALESLYHLYLVASQKIPILVELLQKALNSNDSSSQNDTTTTNGNNEIPSLLQTIQTGLERVSAELVRSIDLCEAVLDLDQAPREFLVRSSYKEELQDIQDELRQLEADLEACHAGMNEQWAQATGSSSSNASNNAAAVRLEEGNDGWQFRLANTNDSKLLQNQLGHFVTVHRLLKNGVYFTTKELRQLACKKQDLVAEYERHQRQVVMDCMKVAATYGPVLERASQLVATLDVLVALAHVAAYNPHGYCQPVMTDGEDDGLGIELKQARHPCVELQDNMEYIPNDINVVFGQSSFLLVTGPNMGGKSTYIRALGAIVTMAQIGSYVPCTSAKINICHHILARVGAGDLQERGISTFMAEMLESSAILKRATKRSLIIIDELGRGTSTFDGYGLARAISEYIVQKIGCMTVFTTHFHELTALEDQEAVVKNCHVTARKGSQGLTFLYEVKPGPCLESYGIQVAEMANVPALVIQDAKLKAKELENFEYHKRVLRDDGNAMEVDDDDYAVDDHGAAEDVAEAMAFVNRFRRLPLDSIVSKDYPSDAEKRAALLQAL